MPKQSSLEKWEISLIKAMLEEKPRRTDQDILAYFTRPSRSLNHRVVSEIRLEKKHKTTKAATPEDLKDFLSSWPDIDQQTGLSARGDELLLKAREAMIAAVNTFNSLGLMFRSELFIVTAIIAWTYLMHAWFKKHHIDFRYKKNGIVQTTKNGAEMFWELGRCLKHAKCPAPDGAIQNLEFLLELRHEIEHKSTDRIDDALSAKLQACCLNFNATIKTEFGPQYALERRLPIALQFVSFSADQQGTLKKANLPPNIDTMMTAFHDKLTPEQLADARFAFRVAFIPMLGKATTADVAYEFIKVGSEEAKQLAQQVLFKEVEKPQFTSTTVVKMMQKEGFPKFRLQDHTTLWQVLKAKNAGGFGRVGPYKGSWVWYSNWVERVRAHCQEHSAKYE
ncbi:MAG: DUF3644 domain-containing protein [Planctomycetota bacterium]